VPVWWYGPARRGKRQKHSRFGVRHRPPSPQSQQLPLFQELVLQVRELPHWRVVQSAGGTLAKEPEPENGEPPHLAMSIDTEGNECMLTRRRG
jgi:hypothetical protein